MDKNNENLMNALVECGAVTLLQKRLLDAIPEFCPDADSHLIDLLSLLLCRQGRGDTRIPLDLGKLDARLLNTLESFALPCNSAYMESLRNAVSKMNDGGYEGVVGFGDSETSFFKKPFTLKDNYLYPSKYFYSKQIVEKRVRELFAAHSFNKNDVANCIERVAAFTKDGAGNPVRLEEAQAEAILRGVYENLIITGGPGTGKTTVIFFLLRELYCTHPELLEHPLYLAAPSGKAADRMKESIVSSMNLVTLLRLLLWLRSFSKLCSPRLLLPLMQPTSLGSLSRVYFRGNGMTRLSPDLIKACLLFIRTSSNLRFLMYHNTGILISLWINLNNRHCSIQRSSDPYNNTLSFSLLPCNKVRVS
jgi:hypothetical protein